MIPGKMIFSLEFGKHSAVGAGKLQNEDVVGYYLPSDPEVLKLTGQMFLVADGQGEIASKIAIETTIQFYFETDWLNSVERMLITALKQANAAIRKQRLEHENKSNYYCSLTCAVIQEDTLYIAYVGNCPAFLYSNNNLEKLTIANTHHEYPSRPLPDHSLIDVTTYRLGLQDDIEVGLVKRQIQIKDVIFLCSQNVASGLPAQEINLMLTTTTPVQACESMVKATISRDTQNDATALIVRVKGIKRLSVEDDIIAPEPEVELEEPKERQIVIKGVRYRENLENGDLPRTDRESMDKFTKDREMHRRIFKRTAQPEKSKFSSSRFIKIALILLVVGCMIFALFKYVPEYWRDLTAPSRLQTITADSLKSIEPISEEPFEEITDTTKLQIIPQAKPKDTTKVAAAIDTVKPTRVEKPKVLPPVQFRVVFVDGSKKYLSLNKLMEKMKTIYATDDISLVQSTYRINESKILWRKNNDVRKLDKINERILQYQNLMHQNLKIKPKAFPLDFTFVMGADFKLPKITDRYQKRSDESDDYYLEILNGSKVPGIARKLSNLLHNQRFQDKKIVIVDYRNADKLNYPNSFFKCESSQNDLAQKLADTFGLAKTVNNSFLYDVKIIIGSDASSN